MKVRYALSGVWRLRRQPSSSLFITVSCLFGLLLALPGWSQTGPCLPPVDLLATQLTTTTARLQWQSAQTDFTDHCWTLELGVVGFQCGDLQHLVNRVICQGDPDVTISGNTLSIEVTGLAPGTAYQFAVVESCDGGDGNSGPCSLSTSPVFQTLHTDFSLSVAATPPDCDPLDPNGTVTLTITDAADCAGTTYDIVLTDADPTPVGNATGVGEGSYAFALPAGQYTATVTETGPCTAVQPTQSQTVTVDPVLDQTAPTLLLTDILGNILADTDPQTNPGNNWQNESTLPEGDCDLQEWFYVSATDLCDGLLTDLAQLTWTTTATNGTRVELTVGPGGTWLLAIHWGVGPTELTLTATDLAGNTASLTLQRQLNSTLLPVLTLLHTAQVLPAACTDTLYVPLVLQWEQSCGLNFDATALTISSNVSYVQTGSTLTSGYAEMDYLLAIPATSNSVDWTATYTTATQSVMTSGTITVDSSTTAAPYFVSAPATQTLILPACTDSVGWQTSIDLLLPCTDFTADSLLLSPASVNWTVQQQHNGWVRLRLDTHLPTGTHTIMANYGAASYLETVTVQAAPSEPFAPNLLLAPFTLPVCAAGDTLTIQVPLPEVCMTLPELTATLAGDTLLSPTGNDLSLYLTPANDGDTLQFYYSYADTLWLTTLTPVQVVTQSDAWAPVIIYPAAGLTAELAACDPDTAIFNFHLTVADDCSPATDIELVIDADTALAIMPLGDSYYQVVSPVGQYQITLTATDAAGNTRQENILVLVTQPAAPLTQLGCADTLNVVLNGNCAYQLTPDVVLTGNIGCLTPADFTLTILDADSTNGPILDDTGIFAYTITTPDTAFAGCWGYIRAFDGTGPLLDCPADTDVIILPDGTTQTLVAGDLDEVTVLTLPPTVPRCYTLASDGQLLAGGQPLALLNRLRLTGFPGDGDASTVIENCTAVQVCVYDTWLPTGVCGNPVLERQFVATDAQGIADTCTQLITADRLGIADVVRPPTTFSVSCSAPYPTLPNGNPHPDLTGYPFIETAFGDQIIDPVYENLGATFVDGAAIDLCAAGFRFLRKWTLTDWCNPGTSLNFTQIIEVADNTPPSVSCPMEQAGYTYQSDTLVVGTGASDCTAGFPVPSPVAIDDCGAVFITTQVVSDTSTTAQVYDEVVSGADDIYVANIPLGLSFLRYIVTDECGNATTVHCPLLVADSTPPTASCVDNLHISLGNLDGNRLWAVDVNEGSADACSPVTLAVRRANNPDCNGLADGFTAFAEWVAFGCCDLGTTVTVELLVSDAAGNTNTCWTEALLEDMLAPTCEAPANMDLDCATLPDAFVATDTIQLQALFGTATGTDNCSSVDVTELMPLVNLDDCGAGTLVRRFRATDLSGNVSTNLCQQTVTIAKVHDYAIRFPADNRIECGQAAGDTIEIIENGCDLLAISVVDERLAAADVCFKIHRTYRVLNWCEYDGVSDPVVVGRDEDCDGMPGDEAVWVVRQPDTIYIDRDSLPDNLVPTANAGTPCQEPHPAGYWRTEPEGTIGFWQYTQVLKVTDTVPPIILASPLLPFCSFDNETCTAPVEIIFLVIEQCSFEEVDVQVFYDEFADGTIDDDVLEDNPLQGLFPKFNFEWEAPIGMHEFIIIATDACGNEAQLNVPFEVVDCFVFSPICINGLTATLGLVFPEDDVDGDGMADPGAVTIWASDFIVSPPDDCSGPLNYSINRVGEAPDFDQTSLTFTCNDLPGLNVEIYVSDNAFNYYEVQPDGTVGGPNYDVCVTYLIVEDDNNQDLCPGPPTAMISGHITDVQQQLMEAIPVEIMGDQPMMSYTASGYYQSTDLPMGQGYVLRPSSGADPLLGVSTLDVLLISKHIQGVQPLQTPQALIAADINRSGNISTLDIIKLRKVILQIDENFPDGVSWRFVPRTYDFSQHPNPLVTGFPERILIDYLQDDIADADFLAIKVGDVSGVNTPVDDVISSDNEALSAHAIQLQTRIEPDFMSQKQRIWVTAAESFEAEAVQFSFQLPVGNRDWEVVGGVLPTTAWSLLDGVVRVSYINENDRIFAAGQPLLILEGGLSTFTAVTTGVRQTDKTGAEAYLDGIIYPIVMRDKIPDNEGYIGIKNIFPNPMFQVATLTYFSAQAEVIEVAWYAVDGRLIGGQPQQVTPGENNWTLRRSQFELPGTYIVHVLASTGSYSTKIVVK